MAMIGRLRGTLVAKRAGEIILEVGGVGYEAAAAPRTLEQLPGVGEEAVVHTHLHVREDALDLYAFGSEAERDLFRVLLGAQGVGPKVGLAIIGSFEPDKLRAIVLSDDVDSLTVVPGIGKRTAQKLVLELRPKFDIVDAELPGAAAGPTAEVRAALENLGYGSEEIRAVLTDLPVEGNVDELLRQALQELGR